MTVAEGTTVYTHGVPPCSAIGLQWTERELQAATEGEVAATLFDDAGMSTMETILTGLAETGFAPEALEPILDAPTDIEDWRVGEAIAEVYLATHRACEFPWPRSRDERSARSSLPGTDLVGFRTDEYGDSLAFGEVKTSGEDRYPPSVMHGSHGLKQQLENLRDQTGVRDQLLLYLSYRAASTPWHARFQAASERYLRDKSDFHLYGFMVRDVPADERDLRSLAQNFTQASGSHPQIELLALYLPGGSIEGIGKALADRRRGAEQ